MLKFVFGLQEMMVAFVYLAVLRHFDLQPGFHRQFLSGTVHVVGLLSKTEQHCVEAAALAGLLGAL